TRVNPSSVERTPGRGSIRGSSASARARPARGEGCPRVLFAPGQAPWDCRRRGDAPASSHGSPGFTSKGGADQEGSAPLGFYVRWPTVLTPGELLPQDSARSRPADRRRLQEGHEMSYSAPTTWFGRFSLLLVALVALIALLGGWPRSVRADGCKPDGQRCATNISCCSGNCMKPSPPPGKAKPLFGVCGTPTSTTTTTTTTTTSSTTTTTIA